MRPCLVPGGLGTVLRESGVAPSLVLERAGLPSDVLGEARTWLTIEAYFALWDAIAASVGDPFFGARLGAIYPEHALEPALLACLGSRDLGEALARLARYKCTMCPEALLLERRAEPSAGRPARAERIGASAGRPARVEVRYDWPTASRRPPAILVEAELSFLLHLARRATRAPLRDVQVKLTRTTPLARAPWTSLFDSEVRFGARIGALSFRAGDLALPFATFNPSLLAILEPALQADRSRSSSIADAAMASVRRVIRRRLGEPSLSLRDVADELGTSARTLQRQLSEQDTSFVALVQDVRRERAIFYLQESDITLSEIAFLLGFKTSSSFFRAFARWTGQTPGAFRQRAN